MEINIDKFKAWDEYVSDKPILKDMIGEIAQGILSLQKNQEAMHERQEKMWHDISMILEKLVGKGFLES